jgi:hypothetical protein
MTSHQAILNEKAKLSGDCKIHNPRFLPAASFNQKRK